MPKKILPKEHLPANPIPKTRHPRIMKEGRRNLAISVDGSLQSMLKVHDHLNGRPPSGKLKELLDESRNNVINSMEYMRDNMHPNEYDLKIIETIISKLKNDFNHRGVLDAYKITCGLKIGKP
ncbi:MAG: hypothetical protein WC915_04350 [archaeon]|jgi:hypothetical protein